LFIAAWAAYTFSRLQLNRVSYFFITVEKMMEDLKEMVMKVLQNKSLTVFLAIAILALLFG